MLEFPLLSSGAPERCMTTAALQIRTNSSFWVLGFSLIFVFPEKKQKSVFSDSLSLSGCLWEILTWWWRRVEILEDYHKQSGTRLWDAKHEVLVFDSLSLHRYSLSIFNLETSLMVLALAMGKWLGFFSKSMLRNMNCEFYEQIQKWDAVFLCLFSLSL